MKNKRRLPFLVWAILVRLKYGSAHQSVQDFKKGIEMFVEDLLTKEEKNILIVSHGLVMLCIEEQLRKRGFTGKKVKPSAHAKVFIFEN